MMLTMRPTMAHSSTKPVRDENEEATRQVRVFEDIGDMVSWIVRVEGCKTANLLDPMIRAEVTARYLKHKDVIDKIRAAEEALAKVESDAKQQAKKGKK